MGNPKVVITREYAEGHSFLIAVPEGRASKLPPIVFTHGAFGFAGYFVPMMNFIASSTGRVCYAIDIMGHGDHAGADIRDATIEHYVADVAHFLKKVVIPAHGKLPVLVGHSMGGLISVGLAERGYAERAVLITPAAPTGVQYRMGQLVAFLPTIVDLFSLIVKTAMGVPFQPSKDTLRKIFVDSDADAALIDEMCDECELRESPLVLNELVQCAFAVDRRALKCPMVVIGAKKDLLVHPETAKEIAVYLGAGYKEFPQLGHMCPMETGWKHVAAFIVEWLKEK